MRDWVGEWVQEGKLWIWRYREPRQNCRGWHFSADTVGCRSIRNLLDRMRGGSACHRTLILASVTEEVLSVPGFNCSLQPGPEKLRIEFVPDAAEMCIDVQQDRLLLTVGNFGAADLSAAFAAVEMGDGDFGIGTSNKRSSEHWMFWWPPRAYRKNR